MHEDELLNIVASWNVTQVDEYIKRLESRMAVTNQLLKDLRRIRKQKSRKVVFDNGPRDNR